MMVTRSPPERSRTARWKDDGGAPCSPIARSSASFSCSSQAGITAGTPGTTSLHESDSIAARELTGGRIGEAAGAGGQR